MNDNFIPTVTITLAVYQNMERRLAEADKEIAKYSETVQENQYLTDKVNELQRDNERLCRIVDGLQVQHRNDQGLD